MENKLKIKLYYYNDVSNFGDMLNINILNKLFECQIEYDSLYNCQLVAIGSLLESFLHGSNDIRLITKKLVLPTLKVWGTGFIAAQNTRIVRPNFKKEMFFRKIKVYAVRGKLTKLRIENMFNSEIKSVIGDPGLLASLLLEGNKVQKKYKIGIIPHYVDVDNPKLERIKNLYKDACVINVLNNPISILAEISACETVISSAMHGLIAADSFGIPNARLLLSDKITGGNFKFDDYYSAFDLSSHNIIDFTQSSVNKSVIDSAINAYNIPTYKTNKIKEELIAAFPYK